MAKKTFVNPFATVGFNQGNYTPYEQQNLLDAEENDRLYQEYLNSGMAQQGFQPQDNSSAIGRGLTAGAAGVIEGQAQLANLLGVGDGQMVQYLQKVNRNNARKKEYSIADMIPFASDYWTNTEGAAYDVANMLGSSGAMMAETAALMTGAGAIGGALGLGGGAAAAAGGGFTGALSRGAGLAPNAVKKLAGKMAAAANNRGYTKLGKALEGPMGQMYALNILKTPVEVSSEAGSAGADALAEGADVWEARKRAGITALVQAPLLAMSNTIEAANLGGLFSKEIGKKATKEAIIGLLGDITKDGLQNAWEEGMQQSSQEYAAGKQSLLGVVNPFQWSPEALQEAAVGAVGGMALGGGNAMLSTVVGDRENRQPSATEPPAQEPTSDTPAPTTSATEEQTIDMDKITPKGARAFLENAQSEMPAGEEYNAISELLDTGSDEDIISKATSMGYGQQETPAQPQQAEQPAEQPTAQPVEQPVEQPTTQPVEQQAEQPVGTPATEQEDWATAQINDAINMIPTQARAKLMNKDGSINWDKVNSDQNVQKALNNSKGIETAIKAINGDEKARNTMKSWGAKKKAAIIHAAQQQMAGQGATQQPVQQEPAKPVEEVKPAEQPAPKPEIKPAPQGDEQNAQAQNQNNGDQNQGVNPQSQQSQTPKADNQGQGQNGQTEQVKPNSASVQQFKDALGDYIVDEYGLNDDATRSYVHKSDDGKDVQRVATIQRTKGGKYSASKNSSDKVPEPKIFDTLEEAEAFIAGKKTSKPTTKTATAKPEPKKEVKPEPAPEPKPEKATSAADENGVVPLEKGMGEKAMNARKDENSKKVLAKSEEIRSKQRNGEITSKEATDAINGLIKKYAKGKVKLINDAAIEQLETDKKLVKAHDQGAMNGLLQQFKAKIDNYIAEAQKLLDSKKYDKDTRSEIESFKGAIEGLLDEFVAKADDFKLKRLKQHEMVFLNAAKKVDRMLEAFDKAKAKAEQEQAQQQEQQEKQEQQEQAQQQSNRVDEFRVLKRMATSAPFSATLKSQAVYEAREFKKDVKELIEFTNEEDYKYGESWGEFLQDFDDYLKAPQEFLEEKLKEKGLPHVAEYDAIIEQYAKAIEQIKNNAADQLKGMFPNVTPIEVNTVEQQQSPAAEPDAQEGESNIGAYADSVLGAGFMANLKAQLAEQKKEEAKGKKGKQKKAEPTAVDQAIEADIQEQQVADQVATNEVVFPEIEAAIESIAGRERATITKYFDQHPEARYIISERLKKGVELFKVPYKDKSGKDNSVYYAKEAGSDEYVKVSKAEAIVMSKVGNLEIKETTKDAMNKEKKAKYVTEISEDEDWEYADALEEGKIEGVKKGDKKAVNIIMDFLTIEFADGKGCPFDKNCKTWGEWVRKVALKGAQYHSEDALDVIFDTDKINLDQKTALSDYFDYLYKKYENKVEDKSRQKKDLEADMVEKPTQTVEAKQEVEVPAEQKAKDEAKQRAAAALKGAFANAKFKTTQVNKNDLDNFDSNIIKQIINAGHIVLNDVGEKIYDGWKQAMTSMIDGLEDLELKYKNYAKRILDSVWDYLSNLPDKVSFAADKLENTLTNIAASLDMALDLQSSGFSYRDAINLLKSNNQKVYNRFKDYLGAAFRAIERYPRKNDIGGDSNVDVRTSQQSAQGNSGRGNGNGLESNSGNNGRGNQMGGGQTAQGATNQQVSGGQVLQAGGSAVSGSGTTAGGAQGNQQSGTQKPDDSASMSGNSNGGRSSGTSKNGSAGNGGKLGQNRKKAQTEAERQARDAAGKGLSELQFNKEPFKAADEQGIAKAVPTLLPEQLKDVVAIEKRLFKNNGKGMLVANGTGTGKTMTGLGEIVRFLQKGARKILIVVPSSNIRDNWVDDGAKVGLPSSAFATITTGKVAPDAINIITYKAFSENQNILKESWDLVVMDECQWVSSGAKSDENERTNTAQTLRAISGHERTGFEDYMQSKYRKEYRELKKLGDKLKKSRKALENLVAQFGAFGQPANQLKANIKSMEDKQKALRRKLDIAEQKERKEYDKRLLARKEDTRVLLLSATPFAYSNSIYYAEGLLFNYDKGSYEDYMVDQFGYERKQDGTVRIQRVMGTSIPMPNHILEARWHDMLVDSGAMINRRLEIQQDYNRRFVKVDGGIGAEIDKGFEILKDYRKGDLNQILAERFDYSKRCRLLEAIKADAAIPMIKEYLKQGKKVVIFHDYKSEEPVGHPFKLNKEELAELSQDARDEYERLRKEHPELLLLEVNAFRNVDQTLEQAFKGKMAAINGNISFDKRTQIVKAFNNDNSGLDIVSVVAEAGKEGISLHDTTGEHPRVLINLGMPTRPTSSIQIEGRIYRLGQKSNAQIRYLYTDTKIEQKAFVDYISARTRTAETLALGDASRNLDGAFAIGYLASKTEKGDFNAANDTVDTGGKLYDTMSKEELETAMKQMYEQLNADGAVDEDMKAKLAERIQELEDERNAKKREEILTEQNEKKVLATIKEAVAGNKVTKVADGVYVVEFVGGARNLWIDLNNSQAAILGQMTEEQKCSMLSAADIKGSGFELQGYYTRELNRNAGAVVDIVRLTEVATTHTLDHEIMHFVHNALLKTLEKQHLEKYFKMLLKKQIGEDAYNKLTEEERLARCEEMEADAYADFCKYDRKPKNMVERIFWKMQKWLAQFAEKFGVETPMGIYIRVRSGEMYGRRDNLSGEEIAQRIRDAGIKPTKIAKTLYQAAWHGTPYIFDEFDNEHNGSGEGPNAHGWGLYFAKNRAVSEEYRERLTQDLPSGLRISLKNGEKYTVTEESQNGVRSGEIEVVNSQGNYVLYEENPPLYSALNYLISANGDLPRALRSVKGLLMIARESYSEERLAEVKGAIRYLEEELADARIEVDSKAGALLNVSIPENDVLLNENKTFEQQPFRVRQALARLFSRTKITPNRYANDIKSYIQGFKVDNQDNVDELLSNIKFALDEFNKSVSELASKSTFNSALFNRKYSDLREELKDNLGEAIRFFVNDSTEELSDKTLEQHQKEDGWIFDQGFYDEWADGNLTIARNEYINEILHSLTRSENFDADGKYLSIFPLESVNPDTFLPKKTGWKILRLLENALGSPKEASLALSKVGIKGIHYIGERDGECFVVFDAASVAIKERYDLALQNNKDIIERSYKECEDEMRKAFPNGKFTPIDANRWLVELKGGARYEIDIKDRIVVNAAEEAKARKDHGLKGKAGEVAITGKYQGITEDIVDGVISLSRKSAQGTGYHEVYHAAWDAVLNDEEKAALLKEYEAQAKAEGRNVQEVIADAVMNNTLKRQANDSRIFSRVKQRVLDFTYALKALFTRMENVHNVMRKIEQGEVWNRTPNETQQASSRYQAVDVNAKTALGEEQPDGTIKFSVKPVDKVDGKGVPDNLDNVVDNKESLEDVKPHGSVQEALQDAQKLGEKNEVEGGIVVKEPKVDKSRDIGLLDNYLHSPSHLAKKNPIFKAFYDIFRKAQSVQEKLRNRWLGQLDGAYKMLKSKEDADAYHNLMVDGELKAKEYSMQELADMGIKDNVAKAYLHTRQMIRNIWEKVNDAHRGLVYRTEKLSAKKVEELSKKPFIENIMVRVVKIGIDNTDAYQPLSEVKLNEKATYEVKYGQPHIFKDSKIVTQEQLDEFKANPYAHVVKEEEYKEVEGLKLFKAEVEQVAPPIGKIAGYLPHIFEQWLVLVETEQGSVPVGSGKNVKEAVKIAESLQKDAPNVQFYIVPKMFNPSNTLGEEVATGSAGGASIVLSAEDFSRLEKSISNTFKMSLAEAREALKPVAKKEGKSRFLGALLKRKGRVGYNTDIADSLSRYIYMTSRYVALQPAKVKAFSLFERTFHGTLGEDYSRTDQLAHVTKNYILHCNGTPNHLETLLTGWLNMIPFWRNYVSTNFGDRSLMSITGRVNGLLSMSLLGGYNISSAVVGLSQLANVYAKIGSRFLGEGMYAYKRMNLRDKRILAETGILYDIGLDTASGFTKRRKLLGGEGDSGLAKAYKFVSYYGDKGMYFFKKADEATRGIAALGAYYKGIEDGMSHKQAIAYAKKVNRDSNFDYGAADAPAIYQRLSGTGIGDLMLLFQKYPIKQFEFMQQMLPYFGSAKKAEKIRFWGAYFLMAGLAGIPLGDWLDELLAKVLGYKPTTAVKSYLFTEFGDNIGTRTLAYGVLSNLGVDVSRRIGMANLAPQGDSVWETALGPGLNILYRMAQSGSDDWAKTIKAFNPSLGNMAEGIRGYKTNSKNQINYIYGDMEKFFKAAGFRTTGESIASDLQSAVYLDKQQKKDARQKLMMEMVKKRIDGETLTPEDYKALRKQGITGAQFQKAVKAAKMTALQRTRAGMTKQQKKDFAGTLVMEEDE